MTKNSEVRDLILLFIGLTIFYLLWLGGHAVLTPDEARYSEIAREMVLSGDYITPRLNGTVFLDKPILYYWLQASAIKLLGVHEWSLRLWPAFIGITGCLFSYMTGRRLFNRRTGLLAAIILATSLLYYGMAHYANVDLEVAVFITIALFAFCIAIQPSTLRKNHWLMLAYVNVALAILTKGLIGIVLPALVIGVWIIGLQNWQIIKTMRLLSGLALILLVTLPWFFLVQKANPDFVQHFFLKQQFSRYFSSNFNNPQPIWFYFPIVLAGIFPWLFFLPATILQQIKSLKKNKRQHQTELLLCIWPLVIFIFFTLPHSKTIGYIIPVLPPLTLLIASYLDSLWDKRARFKKIIISIIVVTILLELALAATVKYYDLPSTKPLAILINKIGRPTDEVATYHKYWQDLALYTQRRITIVADWDNPALLEGDNWHREVSNYFRSPDVRQWLITEDVFWRRWHGDKRIFILVDERYAARFEKNAGRYYRLKQYQDVILYTNKPV